MAGVTRVGATKRFGDNWENIFGGRTKKSPATKPAAKSAKKKAAGKKAISSAKKKRSRK